MFKKRESIFEVEEGNLLSPKFDKAGLISKLQVIVIQAKFLCMDI